MAVPMIAKRIYGGETAEQIGLNPSQYADRKKTVELFLTEVGEPTNFEQEYLAWLPTADAGLGGTAGESGQSCCNRSAPVLQEPDLSFGDLFADLAGSLKAIVKSGVKVVDNEEHARRYAICKECEWFEALRCRQCGCFMKIKSKFSAMRCLVNKW